MAKSAAELRSFVRPPGGFLVLVVDDEEVVRQLTSRMLLQSGYRAIAAGHAREALVALAQDPAAIHLVLTDVKMPGMTGAELGREIATRWPEKPVLYMSGFASEIFQGGLLSRDAPFLAKPFTQEDLATKVRALIGS